MESLGGEHLKVYEDGGEVKEEGGGEGMSVCVDEGEREMGVSAGL